MHIPCGSGAGRGCHLGLSLLCHWGSCAPWHSSLLPNSVQHWPQPAIRNLPKTPGKGWFVTTKWQISEVGFLKGSGGKAPQPSGHLWIARSVPCWGDTDTEFCLLQNSIFEQPLFFKPGIRILTISLSPNRFSILYLGSNVQRDTSPALLMELIFVLLNEAVCSLKVHRDVQSISCTNVSPWVWRPLLNRPSYICMCIYSIPFFTKYIQHARGIFLCFTCWQDICITSHLKVVLHGSLPVAKDTDLLRS